jgi:maltose 6'-phosphate phosphatase
MKMLTLNCHAWLEENQEEKIRLIAEAIKQNNYDVIALQEVNQLTKGKRVIDKIKEDNFSLVLLRELEHLGCTQYKMIWGSSHIGYEVYEEGLSIITKHPIQEEHFFYVTKSKDMNFWKTRKIVGATIRIAGELVDVYSCHLGWWQDEEEPFKEQVDRLQQKIKKDRLTFLLGDFNNDSSIRREGYDYLLEQGWYDTYRLANWRDGGVTVKGKIAGWTGNQKDLRLDLILTNRKIAVHDSKIIFNGENHPIVSDHYGIAIETA